MAKFKALVISGPMDAKHMGGVDVMGGMQPSIIDSYFNNTELKPDGFPSHTFVAAGKIEVPKRSVTVASSIRRPSPSLRGSFSKLRRQSVSHVPDLRSTSESKKRSDMELDRSDSVNTKSSARPLRMQSSLSRLRQRVGLDRDLYEPAVVSKPVTSESKATSESVKGYQAPLRTRKSLSRVISYSSFKSAEPDLPKPSALMHQQPSLPPQSVSTVQRRPLPTMHQPSIVSTVTISSKPLPVRPKRADSGTAIDFDRVPVKERPLPFQNIMAVQSLAERMELYKKTREYWAYADHGLIEWTGHASGPRVAVGQV
jgi:hypothetical protein